jgi:hypothetical protein
MRLIFKLLAIGGIAALVVKLRSKRARPLVMESCAMDPTDPLQRLDDATPLHLEDLAFDAQTVADAWEMEDLAQLETFLDERLPDIPPEESARAMRGSGELYGLHTPMAVDRQLPDDDRAFREGENWVEALGTSATEYGPDPERELDIVDEEDLDSPPTDTRDIPVADRGSAGPRGL